VPLSNFVPSGFGFVHHSIALLYHEVPNPNLTIRNFFYRSMAPVRIRGFALVRYCVYTGTQAAPPRMATPKTKVVEPEDDAEEAFPAPPAEGVLSARTNTFIAMTDAGVRAVSRLTALTCLDISETKVTDAGVRAVIK
jgi:hypothetical protein